MAFTGVVTTGIYCRPGCGGRPSAANCRSFRTAAAAEAAGFRACFQCRPYRTGLVVSPDAPELVCRGVRMILDGVLDEHPESVLARRLSVSTRHLRRLFLTHLGATPDQLARSCRAHFARRLLDDTDLAIADIAFAAGFGSIRQFNRIMRDTFRATPRELRARRRHADRLVADGGLQLRVPLVSPIDWRPSLAVLAMRAVPGVEHLDDDVYRRTITVDGAPGVIEVAAGGDDHLLLTVHLPFWDRLIHVVQGVRHVFNLDAPDDVPGTWDPFELAVVAALGDGLSFERTRVLAGRLVAAHGNPVPGLGAFGLRYTFPTPEVLGAADLVVLGMPDHRAATVRALARAVVGGSVVLDRHAPAGALVRSLVAVDGLDAAVAWHVVRRLGHVDNLDRAQPA